MENGTIGTPVTRCDRCQRLESVVSCAGHAHGGPLCGVHEDCPWCIISCRDVELSLVRAELAASIAAAAAVHAELAVALDKIAAYDAELAAAEVTSAMPPDEFFGSLTEK